MSNIIEAYYSVSRNNVFKKYLIYIILGIVGLNLIILNFQIFLAKPKEKSDKEAFTISKLSSPSVTSVQIQDLVCPATCVNEIKTATSAFKIQPSIFLPSSTPTPTPSPTPTLTPMPTPTSIPMAKEFFIPLGSGFGNSSDWKTINGLEVVIDTSDYTNIESVTFETTIRIPTGNQTVWVRLHNATNYQTVPNSEISHEGGTVALITSKPIQLFTGSNKYQVQLKTQLKFLTYIDQARIRIKVK